MSVIVYKIQAAEGYPQPEMVTKEDYAALRTAADRLAELMQEYRKDHNEYMNSVMRDDGCSCLICEPTEQALAAYRALGTGKEKQKDDKVPCG